MRLSLVLAAALLAILAMPAAARAGEPEATETGEEEASEVEAPEGGPRFLPSASIAIGKLDEYLYGNVWLGAYYFPSGAELTPFFAAGGELDIWDTDMDEGTSTTVSFGPTVHVGVSYFLEPRGLLSVVNVYALAGYRAPSALNNGALRVGLGLSSPTIGLALLAGGVVLPCMAESSVDITADGPLFSWRIGLAY